MNQYDAKIESVCIDNETVRKRLVNDKKIGISVVPTILALYQNGVIEKYEGDDPDIHQWSFKVRDRGAKVYEILIRPSGDRSELPIDES